jgi:hypothetical protein
LIRFKDIKLNSGLEEMDVALDTPADVAISYPFGPVDENDNGADSR